MVEPKPTDTAASAAAASQRLLQDPWRKRGQAITPPRLPTWESVSPTWRWVWAGLAGLTVAASFGLGVYLLAETVALALGFGAFGAQAPGAVAPTVAERATEIRNNMLIVAAALAAPFVIWRTVIAHQQTRVADRQTEINRQTHYTTLYSKAVEMLGADKVSEQYTLGDDGKPVQAKRTVPNIEVRLGAIYALERIAKQSDDDYRPIVETLCAYVRENATLLEECPVPEVPDQPEDRDETADELKARLDAIRERAGKLRTWGALLRVAAARRGATSAERPDIRAALDVLSRRSLSRRRFEGLPEGEPPTLDLPDRPDGPLPEDEAAARGARIEAFRDALRHWVGIEDLVAAAWVPDLASAALQGAARSNGDLRRLNLSRARMEGADLSHARMEGAFLGEARMEGAVLLGARMAGAFLGEARMEGADLSEARMEGADLSEARMEGADLSRARLEGAILRRARMEGAHLDRARMECAVLRKVQMEGAFLSRARMERADLTFARMRGANLRWARMERADLSVAEMEGAVLCRARMERADLSGARLRSADAAGTRFAGAFVAAADFTDAKNLTFEQMASTFGDRATKLPDYLEPERPRLEAEAGWAAEELNFDDAEARRRDWLARRG